MHICKVIHFIPKPDILFYTYCTFLLFICKKSLNWTNFSVCYISLKHKNFQFVRPFSPKIKKLPNLKRKLFEIHQLKAAFWTNNRGVPIAVLLSIFSIWNRFFKETLFPSKHEISANIRRSSTFPENLLSKERKKSLPIKGTFRRLAACIFYIFWRFFYSFKYS